MRAYQALQIAMTKSNVGHEDERRRRTLSLPANTHHSSFWSLPGSVTGKIRSRLTAIQVCIEKTRTTRMGRKCGKESSPPSPKNRNTFGGRDRRRGLECVRLGIQPRPCSGIGCTRMERTDKAEQHGAFCPYTYVEVQNESVSEVYGSLENLHLSLIPRQRSDLD
jgi:hypothetical protein